MENFSFGGSQLSRGQILHTLIRISVVSVITFYSVKWLMNQMDPTSKNKKKARLRAEDQLKRLADQIGFKINSHNFDDYELMIASHLVVPDDIEISWNNIAGLESVIEELRECVVLPIRHKEMFAQSKLCQAPKGVLLHGPPGCGKTLIAKASAKEAGMRFINLDVAILTDKWYGESQKLASAVFSLAKKLEPCIIFIDEIDSFLRTRNSSDHEATAMMKTQFMMLWDGLITNSSSTVIVMGATNRPQDLDKAILRRMPTQFHIGLPTEIQRLQILKLVLATEKVNSDVDFHRLAKLCNGFSGSDIREVCRSASVYRMRELMRKTNSNSSQYESKLQNSELTITMEDLIKSYDKMKLSKMHTGSLFDNRIQLD